MERNHKKELEKFSRKFGKLISSGVPLVKSLRIISDESADPMMKRIVEKITELVISGKRFSESLGEFPEVFSQSYIGMVRAGESQGELDKQMDRIASGVADGTIEPGKGVMGVNPDILNADESALKLNEIFEKAIKNKASDIHLLPLMGKMRVEFRVDGLLREEEIIEREDSIKIIAYLKLMSKLDVAEKRLPQDGRIILSINGERVDMRIAILPVVLGEKATIRILTNVKITVDADKIFNDEEDLKKFHELINLPHGLVIFSGPTGSGKTTTAYAAINELNKSGDKSIVTIEDPVEYVFPGVTSMQIKPRIGFGFSEAITSILRSDPDVIFVGEIRDESIMMQTVKAAATGHLVLSQLHCVDTVDLVKRVLHMNIPPYILTSGMAGIVSQRLVRRVCSHCSQKHEISDTQRKFLNISEKETENIVKSCGCEKCQNTGYLGRAAIYEFYKFSKEFKDVLLKEDTEQILEFIKNEKYGTLRQSAVKLAVNGKTTIDEVMRVTGYLN